MPADFTRASFRAETSSARAFGRIRGGVPGTAMPAWRALSDPEVWDLVAYLRSVSSEGP
jgi:mono/diheme cytochrome c family protein